MVRKKKKKRPSTTTTTPRAKPPPATDRSERPDATPRHVPDTGAPLAVERGFVEIDREAAIPIDPEAFGAGQRRGVRAQRVWAPSRLARGRNPAVETHQLQAAERYYDDYLIGECGARRGLQGPAIRTEAWNRTPYDHIRAERRQSFQSATKAVTQAAGPLISSIVVWCVLQLTSDPDVPPSVDTWAKRAGWSNERSVGLLAAGLEMLAVHYGYAPRSPATIGPQFGPLPAAARRAAGE